MLFKKQFLILIMNFLFTLLLIFIFWEVLTINNIILLSIFYVSYSFLLSLKEDDYISCNYKPRSVTPTKINKDEDSY